MPATFAHPAFAWPLRRLGLPLSALVVGALVPDLAHRLPRSPWTDHTLLSLFTFDVPIGLVVHAALEKLVAPEVARSAPAPWRWALTVAHQGPARRSRLALAVLAGAATHVAVDACTHAYGWPVQTFPFLQAVVVGGPAGALRLYDLLQYLGGIGGALFLVAAAARWDRTVRTQPIRWRDLRGVGLGLAAATACAAIDGWWESYWLPMPTRAWVFAVEGAATGMIALAAMLVVWAALARGRRALAAAARRALVSRERAA